ncbi:MAG: YdbL family protein [Bdellovibrionales bacterium]|nr:YdbL family protein [Bdellovibrionales bacterium]
MKIIKSLVLGLVFFGFSFAMASDLSVARDKGLVKELPTGYIQAVDPGSKALEKSVNAKRKKAYEAIAKKTKTSVEVVGKQAHEKIKKNMKKGK